MKNPIFLAFVFVIGLTSVSLAQFSGNKNATTSQVMYGVNVQDTTKKPLKDTVPAKTDSLPVKKDSSAFNF